jgi:glycosyltransferase involved in cell wall biosynthesis
MNSNKFLKKFNLPKKSPLILYAGRLDPEKRVDVLIKSMKYVLKKRKNVNLMLVGGGSMKSFLEKLSKNLGLEKKIHFLGRVSDEDLSLAYNASDIFVFPSLAELGNGCS